MTDLPTWDALVEECARAMWRSVAGGAGQLVPWETLLELQRDTWREGARAALATLPIPLRDIVEGRARVIVEERRMSQAASDEMSAMQQGWRQGHRE